MIKIDTSDYVATHGKKPKGYGNWLFNLGRDGAWTTVGFMGNYTSAKQMAVREARTLGCEVITLDS